MEHLTEGETESSVKEVVLFSCFALCPFQLALIHLLVWCCDSLHLVL